MLKIELAIASMKEILEGMTGQVTEMSRLTCQSLLNDDFSKMHDIIAMDAKIDDYERRIDRLVAELLALINPMASDFRYVYSVVKINMDLERIGDQCKNIAKEFSSLKKPVPSELKQMAEKTHSSVQDICRSLITRDTELARAVIRRDAEIDAMEQLVINQYAPDYALTLTVRALERAADHCTNIAEYLVYAVEGIDIQDYREKYRISHIK